MWRLHPNAYGKLDSINCIYVFLIATTELQSLKKYEKGGIEHFGYNESNF
jgi:hypothetical protein